MMIIKDVFNVHSYHQITDEELYSSEGKIPVYTGNKEVKGYWSNTFVENINDILPCISFPLKGNNTGYSAIINHPFDANNTGLLVPKSEFRSKINLEWFSYRLRSILIKIQTNKEGVSFINKDILETIEIEIPTNTVQEKELQYFKKLESIKSLYQTYLDKCSLLLSKNIYFDSALTTVQLNTILEYISRNDSLSEEGLYNFEKIISKDNIKVLSGSIGDINYGEIPRNDEVHFLDNKQALHVITRGKAGKLTYLPKGTYATNTNAFILYLKNDIKKELGIKTEEDETYYLKFLQIYLEPLFLDISSNSDVSVFPLTKVFTDMEVPKFILNGDIKKIVKKFDTLNQIVNELREQILKIESLMEKEIIQ